MTSAQASQGTQTVVHAALHAVARLLMVSSSATRKASTLCSAAGPKPCPRGNHTILGILPTRDARTQASVWGSFQGATTGSISSPGSATAAQTKKNGTQPMRSTMPPVVALTKVRGRAARLVKSASCVAV